MTNPPPKTKNSTTLSIWAIMFMGIVVVNYFLDNQREPAHIYFHLASAVYLAGLSMVCKAIENK